MSDTDQRLARVEQLLSDLVLALSPSAFNADRENAMKRVVASMVAAEPRVVASMAVGE